jgi:hypothetical protein
VTSATHPPADGGRATSFILWLAAFAFLFGAFVVFAGSPRERKPHFWLRVAAIPLAPASTGAVLMGFGELRVLPDGVAATLLLTVAFLTLPGLALAPALLYRKPGPSPGSSDDEGGGGRGPEPPPAQPSPPRGGVPLPDAAQAALRLREPGRRLEGGPRCAVRCASPPVARPASHRSAEPGARPSAGQDRRRRSLTGLTLRAASRSVRVSVVRLGRRWRTARASDADVDTAGASIVTTNRRAPRRSLIESTLRLTLTKPRGLWPPTSTCPPTRRALNPSPRGSATATETSRGERRPAVTMNLTRAARRATPRIEARDTRGGANGVVARESLDEGLVPPMLTANTRKR